MAAAVFYDDIDARPRDLRAWARKNRSIIIGLALSLLIHGLVLFIHRTHSSQNAAPASAGGSAPLAVRLAGLAAPAPAPAEALPVPHVAPARPVAPAPRRLPVVPPVAPPVAPPVLAVPTPAAPPIAPPVPQPQVPAAPPSMDMMAQLDAARRRRREALGMDPSEPSTSSDVGADDARRAMSNAMRNLRTLASNGNDESGSGGVFQVLHVSYDNAEFEFHGWNTNFQRRLNEIVPVDRGTHTDIRMAIIDKMIEVIRRYETHDFVWESRRLGRTVSLSARPEDTAGLEEFLMQEFFPEYFRSAR